MADTDDALAEQAVQAPVPAEQPTERPAVEANRQMENMVQYHALVEYGKMIHGSWWRETVVQPTVSAQPMVSRSCPVGGAHVPWRPDQWKFIVVRQAGLQVTIEICCRCGMAYVEEVIEDGGQQ